MDLNTLWNHWVRNGRRILNSLGAGLSHRRQLQKLDIRITVTGVRGKSTAARWLHNVFYERGYDTYAKVTGTEPLSIYNGTEYEIPRSEQVRLYENERELQKYDPDDVAIFENQGIREYTTRLVNDTFVNPNVIFLTNVREDHLGTLGGDRLTIARSLARAIPKDTHVVIGEQDPTIRQFLEREIERRNGTVSYVDVPSHHQSLPGAECVYGIDEVLQAVDEPPLNPSWRHNLRKQIQVSWTKLPSGRVYNAADVNDVQSTEFVRKSLVDSSDTVVEPLIFARPDRRGRTASFRHYFERLFEEGTIHQVHAIGPDAELLARRLSVPTETYDIETTEPADVLDNTLAGDRPVLIVGNTVSEFMKALQTEIESRTIEDDGQEQGSFPGDCSLSRGKGHFRRRRGRHRLARRRRDWRLPTDQWRDSKITDNNPKESVQEQS